MLGSVADKANKLGCSLWLITSAKGDRFSAPRAALRDSNRHGGYNIPVTASTFRTVFKRPAHHAQKTDGAGLPENGGFDGLTSKES
jgi:hypothetical protein